MKVDMKRYVESLEDPQLGFLKWLIELEQDARMEDD